jgi:hypothetical protein
MVIFRNRISFQPKAEVRYPVLDPEAYLHAKQVAPGYDVYFLEQEWRDWWVESGMPELDFLERHSWASASPVTSAIQTHDMGTM